MAISTRKRIFLTGATGNMGSATLSELLARSDRFTVRALVRPQDRDHPVLQAHAGNPALEILPGDLANYEDVLAGVTGADQVLHIGGMVSPLADHFPELTMQVNVGGAANIVRAIREQPDPDAVALVYIGTVAQTGHRGPGVHWGRTGDPIKISRYDHYAVSKTMAEAIIAGSGLKRWVSLRQTGIAYPTLWKTFDPIVFHNPFNGVFEWVTVGDSGRLAANTCEDAVPTAFWRGFYNIGGGAAMRVVNHEYAAMSAAALGGDFRKTYLPHWVATRNFHGQWYADSDRLEALVPFRRETLDDFLRQMAASVPFAVKAISRLAPSLGRRRMQKLAEGPGGTLRWFAENDEPKIRAYFGSREAWEANPRAWEDFTFAQPSREPTCLDHGYDTGLADDRLTLADLRQAADYRGGALVAGGEDGPDAPAGWRCALSHDFAMSPRLMLRGGHWCPTCMVDPDTYDAQAARNPFFAQVWPDTDC